MTRPSSTLKELGPFPVDSGQCTRWCAGELHDRWAREYPSLFDIDDLRLAEKRHGERRHFWEWYGAILLHHMTGYSCLLAKYECKNHLWKVREVERVLPKEILSICRDREVHGRAQAPDLLMYAPDYTDRFFCEVKGPGDSLRDAQIQKFEALGRSSGKPIWLLRLRRAELLRGT